jgi:hypothetical protein
MVLTWRSRGHPVGPSQRHQTVVGQIPDKKSLSLQYRCASADPEHPFLFPYHLLRRGEWIREIDPLRGIGPPVPDLHLEGNREVSSQIFRNFAQLVDEWEADNPGQIDYFGGKSLLTQSHGQSLISFFKARYKIKGVYLSDEPETALSPRSQLELLNLLQEMSRLGHAQFIIATHSPILLACPGSVIYSFNHSPLREIRYEETEHYKIFKDFMENRKRYLEEE